MGQLKSAAFCVCVVSIMFGIIKNILPSNRFERYVRFILCALFIILMLNGIKSVVFEGNFRFENSEWKTSSVTVEEQLKTHVLAYLNKQLNNIGYDVKCTDAELIVEGEEYRIVKLWITDESDKATEYLMEITGLKEEQIDVTTD